MYTYIIESQGLYKIGKATNIKKRISSYRTHNPSFELIKTIDGDYESHLHTVYKEKRIKGEWFNLTKEDIATVDQYIERNEEKDRRTILLRRNEGLKEIDPCTYLVQSAAYRDKTLSLSGGGMRMLLYIMYEIKQSKDWIQILPSQYTARGGKGSTSSYHRAIEELVTEGYITTTLQKYVYWVNPILLFAGNRVGKYPNRVTIDNTHTW